MSSPDALTDLRAGLLAFLEEGPHAVAALSRLVSAPQSVVVAELHALRQLGTTKVLQYGIWALAGYQPSAPAAPPPANRCKQCRARYAQKAGLCRSCGRASGAYTKRTIDVEAERLARRKAELPPPALVARPGPRTRVIDGVEFEIVFDGRQELLGPSDRGGSSLLPAIRNSQAPVVRKDRGAPR